MDGRKGSVKTSPSVGCTAHKEGHMGEQDQLKERIDQLVGGATLEELQILLITIREVLRK